MDAPPDKENCQPFVQVQALMAQAGLRQVGYRLVLDGEAGDDLAARGAGTSRFIFRRRQ